MAKSDGMSPIERHVEKGVVALAAVLLVFALVHWVTGSPRRVQVQAGTEVPPSQVDAALQTRAKSLHDAMKNAHKTMQKVREEMASKPPLLEEGIVKLRQEPLPEAPALAVAPPNPPIVLPTAPQREKPTLANLQPLPKPTTPKVRAVSELPWDAVRKKALDDVPTCRLTASFSLLALRQKWEPALRNTHIPLRVGQRRGREDTSRYAHPVFVRVVVERRARRPDGTWGEPQIVQPWEEPPDRGEVPEGVEPGERGTRGRREYRDRRIRREFEEPGYEGMEMEVPRRDEGRDRTGRRRGREPEETCPEIPDYIPGQNALAVRDALERLDQERCQRKILQPYYWDVYWGAGHRWVQYTWNMESNELIEQVGGMWVEPAEWVLHPPDEMEGVPRRRERDERRRLPRPREPEPEGLPPGMSREDIEGPGFEPIPPGHRDDRIRRTRRDDRTRRPTAREPVERPTESYGPERIFVPNLPSFRWQETDGRLLIVVHDVSPALRRNVAYQYRLALEVANPLLTHDSEVEDGHEEEARTPKTLRTPWSDWSAPATIPRPTEFYIDGWVGKQRLKMQVFARSLGTWVRQDFLVQPGDVIGAPDTVQVPRPPAQAGRNPVVETVSQTVDFSTGAIVVDIDHDRQTVGPDNRPTQTRALLYLDARGRLRTRRHDRDESDPRHQRLQGQSG